MTAAALDFPFSFAKPEWLWLLALVPVLVIASYRALAGLERTRRAVVLIIRSILVAAVALTLAEVHRVRRSDDLTVIFLMDRSLSVRDQADGQEAYMAAVGADIPPEDRLGVIDFSRTAYLQQLPMKGGYFLERGRLPEVPNPERTDIAGAIRLAMAMFPHDTAKRIVLMSDGNDNMGDVLSEARRARSDGVVIDVAPLWYQLGSEIYFDKMVAPTYAEVGEVVAIRMNIRSTRTASGIIDVYHNGHKVPLKPEIARQTLRPGNNSLVLRLPVESDGLQRFEARFIPGDPRMDTNIGNNRAAGFSYVSGRGKVAVMTMNPDYDRALVEALGDENIRTAVINVVNEVPDMAELLDYSAIILANVPANVFTEEQQRMLAAYVRDTGGGLIMTGGDESFGAGGWIGTPVAEVLPVDLEIKHKRIIPRGALALIMHSCEFPRGNYWGKLVAKKSVDTVSSQDYVGVLAYAGGGEAWEVPLQLAANKGAIKNAIDRMSIGDMPDFDTTMRLAVKDLKATDAAQKHVIIISDGDPSPPSPSVLKDMTAAQITCTTIAVGYGQHVVEPPLRRIASATGGRFYAARNPRKLPQIFVKESKIVRRPLIIDEPFRPRISYGLSDLLVGITPNEGVPDLGGLVLTSPKPLSQIDMVRATSDGRDPVLAHWQRGLGRVVAFTSGYWPKWGAAWTRWAGFSKLWAQIVRWTMRQDAPANFESFTTIEGNQGRIVIEALDADAEYLNFLDLQARLLDPDQNASSVQFMQTGPGRYEATFDIERTGQYITNVAVYQEGEYQGSIHSGVSMPFSPELRELETNEALLEEVAEITGGRILSMNPGSDQVFAHNLPPTLSRKPAWDWALAWLLLPLFLLDVACRRLASWLALSIIVELLIIVVLLFGLNVIYTHWWGVLGVILLAELVGWTIRFQSIGPLFDWLTHTVTALGRMGERSAESLAQLKSVRDRVREDRTGGRPTTAPPPETQRQGAPQPDPRSRFDSGEEPGARPVGDIQDALGGAKAAPPGDRKTARPGKVDDKTPEATTARLLKAKRRARRERPDQENQGDQSS